MTRAFRSAAVAATLAAATFVLSPFAQAQRREPQTMATVLGPNPARMVGDIKILNVRNNVWVLMGAGANVTALVFPEGITLVDSGLEANADKVIAALKTLTDQKVTYIINTSAQKDHVGGNLKISKTWGQQITGGNVVGSDPDAATNAEIIGHEEVLNRMLAAKYPADATPPTTYYTPVLKLSTLYHGDAVQLLHEPAAVTDGDSVVWFRGNDILVTGDIFNTTNYPEIDVAAGGSVNGVIDALNHIIDVAFPEFRLENGTLVVPGHGRICDVADVAYYRDMVTIIRDRIQDMIANKKMTLDQVKAQKPTRDYDAYYAADAGRYSPDQFVEAVYKSLSATTAKPASTAKPGAPSTAKPSTTAKPAAPPARR